MAQSPPCILTIAGSDSGGGAGIQADLKTITALQCYGLSALTALTAQNTCGVQDIHEVPADFVRAQLDSVIQDFPVKAAKTGMLFSAEIIDTVACRLANKNFPLVVDPVCVSQSGDKLLEDNALKALCDGIVPLADLITPNRPEAEILSGKKIQKESDIHKASEIILSMGAGAVLLKGGHFISETVVDWLFLPYTDPIKIKRQRINTSNTHGTGCTLSAALAACLGKGLNLNDAVMRARDFLHHSLRGAFTLGEGQGPVNHLVELERLTSQREVLHNMEFVRDGLIRSPEVTKLVPEVGMNLATAIPWPQNFEDIAAFDGRIRLARSGILLCGCPGFGVSRHMSKVLLSAQEINPDINCVANIRFSEQILHAIRDLNFHVAWFSRDQEPCEIKQQEGSTLEWGTVKALKEHERPSEVRVVADRGEKGKEPMLRILAQDTDEMLAFVKSIAINLA